MARNTVARIEIPLDIADVDVVSTRFTRDGKLLIRVESRIEATRCGCCGQEIPVQLRTWARGAVTASVGVRAGDLHLSTTQTRAVSELSV